MDIRRILYLLFFFHAIASHAQPRWVLKKDADSIQVYTRHQDNSKFKSIKAEFTIRATISQLAAMVLDVTEYDRWQYNTIKPYVVKKISDHELIYYTKIQAPWPVSDRDMVVHLVMTQDQFSKRLTIETFSEPNLLPTVENTVRVPASKAKWIVVPVNANKLRVEYIIDIDPGGDVPAWMVNMVCADAPHESFSKLKGRIHRDKAIDLPFILNYNN